MAFRHIHFGGTQLLGLNPAATSVPSSELGESEQVWQILAEKHAEKPKGACPVLP